MSIKYHTDLIQGSDEWRVIPDFPDYHASRDGQIMRVRADALGHRLTGRPLKQMVSKSGYAKVSLCDNGRVKNYRVNRAICAAFHGPSPSPDHHAAHNDGNRLNNNAENLRWVVGVENEEDKRRHGTAPVGDRHWSKFLPDRRAHGEGHGRSKLTEDQVREIRQDNRTQREIATDYGVTQRVVWSIKKRLTWGSVA